jgi:hypothetical protein
LRLRGCSGVTSRSAKPQAANARSKPTTPCPIPALLEFQYIGYNRAMTTSRLAIPIALLMSVVVGCRARPAPDAGFLQQTQLMKKDKDFPYDRIYLTDKAQDADYTEIYVAPVNIDHMLKLNLWEVFSTAYLFPDDVKKNHRLLADYTRNAFIKAIEKDPNHRLKVVDQSGPHTLILESAIVQVTPSKPLLYLGSYIDLITYGVLLGAPIVFNSEDNGNGLIAIEARMRDGGSGEVVGMFADRERPPLAAINLKALAWWEPVKPIVDTWARQFVLMENGVRGKENKKYPTIQILVF